MRSLKRSLASHLFLVGGLVPRPDFPPHFLGDAHPIVEVCHDVGRASLRGVLKRLSGPSCETVQRLGVGCPASGVLRRWRAVQHDRVDVFLPVSEPTGLRSSLQLQRRVGCSYHVPRLPGSLVYKNGHSCKHVGEACLLVSPISLRSTAHAERRWTCIPVGPRSDRKKSRVPAKLMMCASISVHVSHNRYALRALNTL